MKYSMKKSKLNDFGGAGKDFIQMYNSILESPSHKKQAFHNLGYVGANIELNMTLARRLTFVQYIKENPSILDIPVRAPVFVMGLPRTGTTFLHRLLSLDPKVRAPTTWELFNPVPRVKNGKTIDWEAHESDRQQRRKFVTKMIETRRSMGDNALAHIHEIGADLPEECLLCLTDNLPCLPMLLYDDYMNIEEFLKVDPTPAYSDYKKYLQLLSFQVNDIKDPKGWMLKCPIHMFYPKAIAAVFPDAKLIWNHRHPVSAVPSLCSLLKAFHQLYYEPEGRNDKVLGKKIKDVSDTLLQQTPKDVAASKLECSNVIYNDLVSNPLQVVKDIYKQFKWEYTPAYEAELKAYLKKNTEEREALKKAGAFLHEYDLDEFGLTQEELCSGGFADYCQRYNVPMSKN